MCGKPLTFTEMSLDSIWFLMTSRKLAEKQEKKEEYNHLYIDSFEKKVKVVFLYNEGRETLLNTF